MAYISSCQTLHLILPVQYMIMMSYSSPLSHYLFILLVSVITYRCEYFVLQYRYVFYCFIFLICILVVLMHRWVGNLSDHHSLYFFLPSILSFSLLWHSLHTTVPSHLPSSPSSFYPFLFQLSSSPFLHSPFHPVHQGSH